MFAHSRKLLKVRRIVTFPLKQNPVLRTAVNGPTLASSLLAKALRWNKGGLDA